MKESNTVYKLAPCQWWDVENTESWLEDMSEIGLRLSKDGFVAGFGIFERAEKRRIRYRLEASVKNLSAWDDNAPDEEAEGLADAFGWEYVAARGQFFIFRCLLDEAPELNTDAVVQSMALNAVRKRETGNAVSLALWIAVWPLLVLRFKLVITTLALGSWFMMMAAVLVIWEIIRIISRIAYLRKLRKKLAYGVAPERGKNWRRGLIWRRTMGVLFAALFTAWTVALIVIAAGNFIKEDRVPLEQWSTELPFATIRELTGGENYELIPLSFTNTVEKRSDLVAPLILDYNENASVTINDSIVSGGLSVTYFETVSPWLAGLAARELYLQDKQDKHFQPLEAPAIDADYCRAYTGQFPTVVIQKGNVVVRAVFYQTSEAQVSFSEWVTRFANSLIAE